jgi:hypothetical protein
MDIKNKRDRNDRDIPQGYPGLDRPLGSAANDSNMWWFARSSSWQGGANADFNAIEAEKKENDLRFGVPHEDNLPNPNGVPDNCGASYQVASRDTNDTLPNPHNWSSNPGYMGTSTSSMLTASAPGTGGTYRGPGAGSGSPRPTPIGKPVVGRTASLGKGNIAMPAPGDTDPRSEGSPQGRTSGFGG